MKIKTKNSKEWRHVYHKFVITQRFNIEDTGKTTPREEVRLE